MRALLPLGIPNLMEFRFRVGVFCNLWAQEKLAFCIYIERNEFSPAAVVYSTFNPAGCFISGVDRNRFSLLRETRACKFLKVFTYRKHLVHIA